MGLLDPGFTVYNLGSKILGWNLSEIFPVPVTFFPLLTYTEE
jgi:hypothetical protein